MEEAQAIARTARAASDPHAVANGRRRDKNRNRCGKPAPGPMRETPTGTDAGNPHRNSKLPDAGNPHYCLYLGEGDTPTRTLPTKRRQPERTRRPGILFSVPSVSGHARPPAGAMRVSFRRLRTSPSY